MTTTTAPDRTLTVLRAGALWVLAAAIAVTVTGALAAGSAEALSALAGAGVVLIVLVTGMLVVGLTARTMPGASLLVALLTYLLQVVVLALLAVRVPATAVGEEIAPGWLAAGLIAATFAWMGGVMLATVRLPLTPLPGPATGPGGRSTEASAA